MEKALEIETHEEGGDAMSGQSLRSPKEQRRQQRASDDNRRKIGEEFGGVFQRR